MFLVLGFSAFQMIIVESEWLRGVREKPTASFTDHTEFQSVRAWRGF